MGFDDDLHPPAELRTDEFLLRPIRMSDAERDHEAVMESRDFLRTWEQSTWPEDDFTVEVVHLHRDGPDRDTMSRLRLRLPDRRA